MRRQLESRQRQKKKQNGGKAGDLPRAGRLPRTPERGNRGAKPPKYSSRSARPSAAAWRPGSARKFLEAVAAVGSESRLAHFRAIRGTAGPLLMKSAKVRMQLHENPSRKRYGWRCSGFLGDIKPKAAFWANRKRGCRTAGVPSPVYADSSTHRDTSSSRNVEGLYNYAQQEKTRI